MSLTHDMRVFVGCQRKKQYISVEEAQMKIRKVEQTRGVTLYWYHCLYCHAVHLTKKPNANPRY